jgi:hypothetical protein
VDVVAVGNAIWFCWQHRGYVQLLCGYARLLASQDPLTVVVTALPALRRMLQPARMVREWAQPRLLQLLNEARDLGKVVLTFLVIVLVVMAAWFRFTTMRRRRRRRRTTTTTPCVCASKLRRM